MINGNRIRLIPLLLGILLLGSAVRPMPAHAADTLAQRLQQAVLFKLDCPVAWQNAALLRIDEASLAVKPISVSGRTLLPVRFLAERIGADVQFDGPSATAIITAGGKVLRIALNAAVMDVNGTAVPLDVPAQNVAGRILVPMRAICEALGKEVDWHAGGLIVVSDRKNLLDPVTDAALVQQAFALFAEPVSYRAATVSTASGSKTVHVVTVRPDDPRVRFEVGLPDTMLDRTADFAALAREKGAQAAINANFFSAYTEIKDPIGHVMIDGELVFGQSGLTSLGITRGKQVVFSKPGIFTHLYADGLRKNDMIAGGQMDYSVWDSYEVNTRSQSATNAILYTPRRGASIAITATGHVLTVRGGKIAALTAVAPGLTMGIPSEGFLVFYGENVTKNGLGDWDMDIGRTVEIEHYLFRNTNADFHLGDMQWMISGGPDLVVDGAAAPVSTSPTFADARFTTNSAPRTAAGTLADGRLVLVTTGGAKISDMKEIMLALGCRQAINLDGGGSCGMFYGGKTLMTPGRKLATMFYVYDH